MSEDESTRRARDLYESLPEEMRQGLIKRAQESARVVCERQGVEPTEALVAGVVMAILRHLADNSYALVREALTEEGIGRLTDEEYVRLDEGGGVEEGVLAQAVTERALREHAHILYPRHTRPPS